MSLIHQELEAGATMTDQILFSNRPWKDLFVKHTFFTNDFKYYLSVTCSSTTKEAHRVWSGFVESKVRVLVQNLERHQDIGLARPFNKGYERVHSCKNDAEVDQVQNGSLAFVTKETKTADPKIKTEEEVVQATAEPTEANEDGEKVKTEDGQPPASEQPVEVYTTTHYIGLLLAEGKWPSSPLSPLTSLPLSVLSTSPNFLPT